MLRLFIELCNKCEKLYYKYVYTLCIYTIYPLLIYKYIYDPTSPFLCLENGTKKYVFEELTPLDTFRFQV